MFNIAGDSLKFPGNIKLFQKFYRQQKHCSPVLGFNPRLRDSVRTMFLKPVSCPPGHVTAREGSEVRKMFKKGKEGDERHVSTLYVRLSNWFWFLIETTRTLFSILRLSTPHRTF